MTEAEELLDGYHVTDGILEMVEARPGKIVLRGIFSTFHEGGEWTGRSVEIKLLQPCGTSIQFNLPPAFGDEDHGEFGIFDLIEAKGTLNATAFRLETSFGHIVVDRCQFHVSDWDDSEWRK